MKLIARSFLYFPIYGDLDAVPSSSYLIMSNLLRLETVTCLDNLSVWPTRVADLVCLRVAWARKDTLERQVGYMQTCQTLAHSVLV